MRAVFAPIPGTWPALVPLVQSGRLALLGDAFTHRMALEDVSEAYELFDSRADGVLKVLLTPNPGPPSGSIRGSVEDDGPLRGAELRSGHEPRRRRRSDQLRQRVDDRLVVGPPALEVAPRLFLVALQREVDLFEPAVPVEELRLGEPDV